MEENAMIREQAKSLQLSLQRLDESIELKSIERNELISLVASTESIAVPVLRSFDKHVYGMTSDIEKARAKRAEYAKQLKELSLQLA